MRPRCVLVERSTEYRDLLARHGTREQARFFLDHQGLSIDDVRERHESHQRARAGVLTDIPADWRIATVDRSELDRFLFAEDDIVVVLGQDGLVANTAKYLGTQPVIGLNPDRDRNPGVLVRHLPEAAGDLLADAAGNRLAVERRTMVEAALDDGQRLLALNEVFLGHHSHQSARYTLEVGGVAERQSSSGVIVASGTGATGWAASINGQRPDPLHLPTPTERALAWFVREPWPGPATGISLDGGTLDDGQSLVATSELGEGATLFGDGIEADRLQIDWGQRASIGIAEGCLRLAV